MRWNWKRSGDESAGRQPPVMECGEIREALEGRGVAREFSELLSSRLELEFEGLAPESRGAMLDGVATAFELQREIGGQLTRSVRGLREVERMMGAFSGELSKLDEVLEVLAAYVRKMRTSGSGADGRTLH